MLMGCAYKLLSGCLAGDHSSMGIDCWTSLSGTSCLDAHTFLMVPLMPETVRTEAPSNLATSRGLLNMPPTKAVCLCTLKGSPTSLSFFTTLGLASAPMTTPDALMRHPCMHRHFTV